MWRNNFVEWRRPPIASIHWNAIWNALSVLAKFMLISFKIVPAKDKLITVLGNFFATFSMQMTWPSTAEGRCIPNFYKQNFEQTARKDGNMLESQALD